MSAKTTGSVLVAGGGIAGIQASLDLANSGYKVWLLEKSSSIGGVMAQLDKTFPTNDCSMCIMSPKLVEVGRHDNIELITLADITGISGKKGDFKVSVVQKPRYIDTDKCIACGVCAQKCPKKVDDVYNEGIVKRRAAYVLYPQAVPLKYAIDDEHCIFFAKGKCKICQKKCPADAVNFDDREKRFELNVGAVILAPGFSAFDPSGIDTFGYDDNPNVMTALEFERILSASGPTSGHLVRMSDEKEPARIAWLQCVGSRDINRCDNPYCSSVCCMYAIKQAIIAKEHSHRPLDCTIFFMDMRTHGKGFEDCFNQARDKHGINFVRSRIHTIRPNPKTGDQILRYVSSSGGDVLENFDMVVLSVGLTISGESRRLAEMMGVDVSENGFCIRDSFRPTETSRDGIYVCGALAGPKDIPQSVIEAGSAALMAGSALYEARDTLTVKTEAPEERDIRGERPKIGVFVCQCGINISGVVDVPAVRDYAATLPYVDYTADNLYSCSQDTQDVITGVIREKGLNRIVVAACSPKTHEPLFRETLAKAGLNKYLLEFVNIRNQNSWVHMDQPEEATAKACDLVRMAVSKAAMLNPLKEEEIELNQRALVLGGGVSGMAAALALSSQGYETIILERGKRLGGQALKVQKTFLYEDVQENLKKMIQSVEDDPKITCHLNSRLKSVEGFVGNFESVLESDGEESTVKHGVAVIATGAYEHQPVDYEYGGDPRIITGLELNKKLLGEASDFTKIQTAVFIQCVGSREPQRPYCSRLCCTQSILSAIRLKEMNPNMSIYILYRDIRTYGERERLYIRARELGVIFIRFDINVDRPAVKIGEDSLTVTVVDHILNVPVEIKTDLLTLASAIVPYRDEKLAQFFKVPMNEDGFFTEAHVKLNPSAFATDGVFLCGLCHYPKPVDESIAQAQAAASSATALLSRLKIRSDGNIACANPQICSSCGVCVSICPYNAPSFETQGRFAGKATINPALCKGCGLCIASCRSGALQLAGFEDAQIMAMIEEA